MTRHDPGLIVGPIQHLPGPLDKAVDMPAMFPVDERVAERDIHVSRVHCIEILKVKDYVAVGMRVWHVHCAHGIAVEMETHSLAEGDDRQGHLRRGRQIRSESRQRLRLAHQHSHVVVGEDLRPGLAEILVAAGMVEVPMGVEQHVHGPAGKFFDCGHDLRGQRSKLIVDHEYAVITGEQADISSGAQQHIETLGHRDRANLYVIHILLRAGGQRNKCTGNHKQSFHDSAPVANFRTNPEF